MKNDRKYFEYDKAEDNNNEGASGGPKISMSRYYKLKKSCLLVLKNKYKWTLFGSFNKVRAKEPY